jgi:hypothetical protein
MEFDSSPRRAVKLTVKNKESETPMLISVAPAEKCCLEFLNRALETQESRVSSCYFAAGKLK